jgi:hypothetical protein
MAIPTFARKQALEEAPYHVQVELLHVQQGFRKSYGNVQVIGRVLRIFKGAQLLTAGTELEFDVPVLVDEDEWVCGGVMFLYRDLLGARYMEVSLDSIFPACHVASDLREIIDAPTDAPRITFDMEEPALPVRRRKWWQW